MIVGLLVFHVVKWVVVLAGTYTLLHQYLSEGGAVLGPLVTVFWIGPLFIEIAKEVWRRET